MIFNRIDLNILPFSQNDSQSCVHLTLLRWQQKIFKTGRYRGVYVSKTVDSSV